MDDFGEFYAARKDAVFRAMLVATGSRAAAEDAVAEAFVRAYGRWSSVREHPNPTAWVILTALNVHRSLWRRLRRELLGAEAPVPAVPPVDSDLAADVRAGVAALPVRQRQVVALRVLADLSADETGRLLGISTNTVHSHLHRALGALRTTLREAHPATKRELT